MKWLGINIVILFFSLSADAQLPKELSSSYELIWQDEFDGRSLDSTKWKTRFEGSLRGNAYVSKSNSYLDGKGHLIIEARKTDTTYTVGQISTMGIQTFRYGYFECRVAVTKQVGTEAAFWLQSPSYTKFPKDSKKSGAEIDILEYRFSHKDEAHHAVHWGGYEKHHRQKSKDVRIGEMDEDGFRTFGVEWTPKKYTFYMNGKKTWCTRKGISRVAEYLILSVEMIDWCGDPSNSTFPDRAHFDYVRVYQKG